MRSISVAPGDRSPHAPCIRTSQNIFLQAQALGLGAGIVGAFHDGTLIDVMQIPSTHEPLSLMPVGHQG
ncbi:MAG: nitroreductase family protein [Desulfosarcina sp.]